MHGGERSAALRLVVVGRKSREAEKSRAAKGPIRSMSSSGGRQPIVRYTGAVPWGYSEGEWVRIQRARASRKGIWATCAAGHSRRGDNSGARPRRLKWGGPAAAYRERGQAGAAVAPQKNVGSKLSLSRWGTGEASRLGKGIVSSVNWLGRSVQAAGHCFEGPPAASR